ncbi:MULTISPECIES: MmpS family transport accessory protein [Mycobacterium avium complex (MAC)]|jgi:hypothetical protein|nr:MULTISPECIES: MmpS family transport accessory protein [Mycobacterium avium complex (MAC)]ETZ44008.1 conserved membrane family protein [Mycobacterium avium MAV_061107_1842]
MFRTLRRAWMPLLLVVVISLGAYAVVRIRGVASSTVVYESDLMSGTGVS